MIELGRRWAVKLDLSEIVRTPGAKAEHEIEITLREIEGMALTAPLRGQMTITSTGTVLLLEGFVDTEIEQLCCRCGDLFRLPVHAEIQEDLIIHPGTPHGPAARIDEDDEAPESRLFYAGTLDLNLEELLRQSILLALPLKPLCCENCPGLCPHCGHMLSQGPCACRPDATNPQMAALQHLLETRQSKDLN
jgi:uncharacterized protein